MAGVAPSVSTGTFFSCSSVVISLLNQNPSRRWRPCFLRVAVTGFYSEQTLANVYSFFMEHQYQPEQEFYSYLGWKINEFAGMICRLMDQRLLTGACVTLKPLHPQKLTLSRGTIHESYSPSSLPNLQTAPPERLLCLAIVREFCDLRDEHWEFCNFHEL